MINEFDLAVAQLQFRCLGFAKLPQLFKKDALQQIVHEVSKLSANQVRRDFTMPDYDTPRNLSVVGGKAIRKGSPFLLSLYESREIKTLIEHVTGTEAYEIDHAEEFAVINTLEEQQDTHGWHLDDPDYALIIITHAAASGGEVEIIPSWNAIVNSLDIGGSEFCKQLDLSIRANLIRSANFDIGDCYLLHASKSLHRVAPVVDGARTAINFAYHAQPNIEYGETANLLYG